MDAARADSAENTTKSSIQDYLSNIATDPNERNRKQCGQAVLDVLKEQPIEDILQHIRPIASTISMAAEDTDIFVRATLVQLIPEIYARCIELGHPELDFYLFDRMLEITLRFLKNEENMVRESAISTIKTLLLKNYLGLARIEEMVCPTSVDLLNLDGLPEDILKERNSDAFAIMALLAPIIGAEKTKEFFLQKYLELCVNEYYDVRKMCAVYCPHLCKVLGQQSSEEYLIPAFLKLCEDKIWDIRKAAADSIRIVGLLCSDQCRREKLCPVFFKLMNDSCRWVYRAAAESLGLFISSFARPCILGVAYKLNGDLYIPNPADAEYKQHSESDIVSNYEQYERLFEESATRPSSDNTVVSHPNNKLNYNAIVRATREPAVENPHFSLPETFHNALSFRNYENHGFSTSITNLLDTFIVQNDNNSHSQQRIPRGGHFDMLSPTSDSQSLYGSGTSSSAAPDYNHLRKNTPRDFPLIVRQAMEKQDADNSRKFTLRAKVPRQNAALYMPLPDDDSNQLPPPPPPPPADVDWEPDTPSIESAPESIDFASAVNSNLSNNNKFLSNSNKSIGSDTDDENNTVHTTSDINLNLVEADKGTYESNSERRRSNWSSGFSSNNDDDDRSTEEFLNNIYALQLDDNDGEGEFDEPDPLNESMQLDDDADLNVSPTSTADSANSSTEDDDDVFKEFNSHQYWYISPDIPVDMDIFLEPEEKKLRLQLEEEHELRRFDRVKIPNNYDATIVPGDLIKYFVSLAHSQDSTVVNYFCAYHFPAVVLTLGRTNWPTMCSLLQSLCNHGIDDIRKTMASSIYLIALIVGRELATHDLVPIYLRFFEDQDKVKVVALKNLMNFLSVINRPQYDIIIAALSNCLGEYYEAGWRFREELAQQILSLVKVLNEAAWETHKLNLTGITIKLLRDRVNSIRKMAIDSIIEICKKLSVEECDAVCCFLSSQFGSNSNWRHRQIFSEFCYRWMALETSLYPDVFNDRLFNRACHLVKDAVPNIRMTIAKCFSLVLTKQTIDTHRHMVTVMILRRMQQDEDSDVRDIALSCELPATDEEINESARDLHETVSIDDTRTNLSSLSTTSTVDLNSTEGGVAFGHDNDESDESQDSIRLYLDTDEKNMSSEESSSSASLQTEQLSSVSNVA